jgi:hypothetical protein
MSPFIYLMPPLPPKISNAIRKLHALLDTLNFPSGSRHDWFFLNRWLWKRNDVNSRNYKKAKLLLNFLAPLLEPVPEHLRLIKREFSPIEWKAELNQNSPDPVMCQYRNCRCHAQNRVRLETNESIEITFLCLDHSDLLEQRDAANRFEISPTGYVNRDIVENIRYSL